VVFSEKSPKECLLSVVDRLLLVGSELDALHQGPEELEGLVDNGLFGGG